MEAKPLLRLLTEAGLGSRRGLADAIRQGRVQIDGHVAESFLQPVDPERETVTVDGEAVTLKAEPRSTRCCARDAVCALPPAGPGRST